MDWFFSVQQQQMSDSKLVKALTDSAQRKLSRTKKNGGPGLTQNIFFILCFGLSQNCHFLSLIVSLRKIINYVYSRIFSYATSAKHKTGEYQHDVWRIPFWNEAKIQNPRQKKGSTAICCKRTICKPVEILLWVRTSGISISKIHQSVELYLSFSYNPETMI